jgi:threonyl-tRNA synthetase
MLFVVATNKLYYSLPWKRLFFGQNLRSKYISPCCWNRIEKRPSWLPPQKRCVRRLVVDGCAQAPTSSITANDSKLKPRKNISNSRLPTNETSPLLLKIRHTCAHVMAMAVQKLFPEAKVTIGPWIENGFYYDFSLKKPLTEQDLENIQREMKKIIQRKLPLRREVLSREEAKKRIEEIQEPYKLEILDSIADEPITIYYIGNEWWDLCAGPHVEHTGMIDAQAFRLETVAGAYWRGDENREMLQRIYGTAWETKEQLEEYLKQKEEAKKRDHRVIGQQLDLFSIQEEAGGGLVFWHPKGALVRSLIEDFWRREHLKNGYELLYTPHIAKVDLWKISGHYDFYRDSMFQQIQVENDPYQLKPMNCPFHCLVYKNSLKSYRDLPIRWAELGTVYRYERSGTLHGLMRVRGFTQDDAHIFCLEEQLSDEIRKVLLLAKKILSRFGFNEFEVTLSTRPEKYVGSDEIWEKATNALKAAMESENWHYTVDQGGGAFYGPKIDIKVRDAIGRLWQCSTIQCDFNLPERFQLEYVTKEGHRNRPIMVHRAIFGSLERFFGILLENCAGDLPLWLAPVQLRWIGLSEEARTICHKYREYAEQKGLRTQVDQSGDRISKCIRNGEIEKIPLLAIIGAKELEQGGLVSVRSRTGGDLGPMNVDTLLSKMMLAIQEACDLQDVV